MEVRLRERGAADASSVYLLEGVGREDSDFREDDELVVLDLDEEDFALSLSFSLDEEELLLEVD